MFSLNLDTQNEACRQTNIMASKFGMTHKQVFAAHDQAKNSGQMAAPQMFEAGDVIACFAGFPHKEPCIIKLAEKPDWKNNLYIFITGESFVPSQSHAISSAWFKIA